MSSRLSRGTYNGGLLSTEAGTIARVIADGTITLAGYLGQSRLLNITLLPSLFICISSIVATCFTYNSLYWLVTFWFNAMPVPLNLYFFIILYLLYHYCCILKENKLIDFFYNLDFNKWLVLCYGCPESCKSREFLSLHAVKLRNYKHLWAELWKIVCVSFKFNCTFTLQTLSHILKSKI